MDPTTKIDADIQVGTWAPTDTVRIQIGGEFVDPSPLEVEVLVAWLSASKEEAAWRRSEREQMSGGEL